MSTNYAGWNFCSGIGPKTNLNFNEIISIQKQIDPKGDYIKAWCSKLKEIPEKFIYEPWTMKQGT